MPPPLSLGDVQMRNSEASMLAATSETWRPGLDATDNNGHLTR